MRIANSNWILLSIFLFACSGPTDVLSPEEEIIKKVVIDLIKKDYLYDDEDTSMKVIFSESNYRVKGAKKRISFSLDSIGLKRDVCIISEQKHLSNPKFDIINKLSFRLVNDSLVHIFNAGKAGLIDGRLVLPTDAYWSNYIAQKSEDDNWEVEIKPSIEIEPKKRNLK